MPSEHVQSEHVQSEHVQSEHVRTVHKECAGGVGRIVNSEVVELGCVEFESAGEG